MSDVLTLKGRELTSGPHAPGQFADAVTGPGAGRALVQFEGRDHPLNLELSLSLLSSLGPVVSVYPGDGCWSDLAVSLAADPGRTHGIGENRLHVDLVDRDRLPRYIALYCVRADPLGGGASALADLWQAADALSNADRALLTESAFSYYADADVHGVGESLDRFPVLPPRIDGNEPIRFTAKMGPHLDLGELLDAEEPQAVAAAFGRFVDTVYACRSTIRLQPGDLLVVDQHRYAHGRMPLGDGQDRYGADERRLLRQTYVGAGAVGGTR
ncbi:TauD/TfdA family dioxygenase [Streptomyces sp. GQFP]|uniref:TauD/TfdA family dioxygenase n=1 Tax=Streptomyces sp. GQFP TaxID=2907545 RepID=UPI001F207463|nr:TauD/TfdA family dioxygenase [Streptomyces sp. GQFP]UIX34280.1 TauD/TfdA family dioxygenase [Streptomyces sp. GQFP]